MCGYLEDNSVTDISQMTVVTNSFKVKARPTEMDKSASVCFQTPHEPPAARPVWVWYQGLPAFSNDTIKILLPLPTTHLEEVRCSSSTSATIP